MNEHLASIRCDETAHFSCCLLHKTLLLLCVCVIAIEVMDIVAAIYLFFKPCCNNCRDFHASTYVLTSLNHYHVCTLELMMDTLAYGQTGTGKTWTMEGLVDSDEKQGVIPRSVRAIFEELEGRKADVSDLMVVYLVMYILIA